MRVEKSITASRIFGVVENVVFHRAWRPRNSAICSAGNAKPISRAHMTTRARSKLKAVAEWEFASTFKRSICRRKRRERFAHDATPPKCAIDPWPNLVLPVPPKTTDVPGYLAIGYDRLFRTFVRQDLGPMLVEFSFIA